MTQTQLAAKRSKRNAASRAKAKEKYRLMGEMDQARARLRDRQQDYLADMAMAQHTQELKANEARRWALESRRAKVGVSEPTPNTLVSRVKSFFKGRGR